MTTFGQLPIGALFKDSVGDRVYQKRTDTYATARGETHLIPVPGGEQALIFTRWPFLPHSPVTTVTKSQEAPK